MPQLIRVEAAQSQPHAGSTELLAIVLHAELEDEGILGRRLLCPQEKLLPSPSCVVHWNAVVEHASLVGLLSLLIPNDHCHPLVLDTSSPDWGDHIPSSKIQSFAWTKLEQEVYHRLESHV